MMPNLTLAAPANDIEMKLALEFALSHDGPVVIRYPKDVVPPESLVKATCRKPFKLGKSVNIKSSKKSKHVIISYGSILTEAIKASEILKKEGISVDIINARFATPIDEKILSILKKGKSIVTVEDHTIACGFGSAVLEMAAANKSPLNSIRILGAPRELIGHNSRDSQLFQVGINAEKIAEAVREMTG
jgi:1-deoxy-D-xylulose-5-phosphate synthase